MPFASTLARLRVTQVILCLLMLSGVARAQSNDQSLPAKRLAFVAAEKTVQLTGGIPAPVRSSLVAYPLYPYLEFADISSRLGAVSASEIDRFLTQYSDSPLSKRLRKAWIKQLHGRGSASAIVRYYQAGLGERIECQYRSALLTLNQPDAALADIESLWTQGRSVADECDPVFALWRQRGGFTAERVWQRFQLAVRKGSTGTARYSKKLMPAADQADAELWLKVDADPSRILQGGFSSANPRHMNIVLHGLWRWSRKDSVSAASALDQVKKQYALPADQLLEIENKIGVYMAGRAHPDAGRRLQSVAPNQRSEEASEWLLRDHLRKGQWQGATTVFGQMSADQKKSTRWQYWQARALEQTGNQREATKAYARIARQRDYYSFMAADRIGQKHQTNEQSLNASQSATNAIEQRPAAMRAHELFKLGRYWEARSEWTYAIKNLDANGLQAAAALAHQWGWHDRAIATLGKANHWNDLQVRFPTPHQSQVLGSTAQEGIEPAWVYAVMRQESLFQPDARSGANARGLMQILPATGKQIARDLGTRYGGASSLYIPEINIRFGTRYLRTSRDKLQDNMALSTAAYNAGPGRVKKWLPENYSMDGDVWAELVPFKETRDYVRKVMEYTSVYQSRLGLPQKRVLDQIKSVHPAGQ